MGEKTDAKVAVVSCSVSSSWKHFAHGRSPIDGSRPSRAALHPSSSPGATVRYRLNLALGLVLAGDSKTAEGIARFDLDPDGARDQIAYFETIKALGDSKEARAAIRAHIRGNTAAIPPNQPRTFTTPDIRGR